MARGRALIVDDSSTARIILARLLERADISTKGVVSAEEAFTRLQNETFDIIFLDHLLPGMDGFQALEKLKSQSDTREIPVFMYTSQNAERYLQEAKARGAAGVIGKQVDREHLLKTIDAILTGTPEPEHSEALLRAVEEEPSGGMSPKTTSTRRITGRLATLEVAYEEADEEITHLRHALTDLHAQNEALLQQQRKSLRKLWAFTITTFVVVGGYFAWELGNTTEIVQNVNNQLVLIQEIMSGLVELVER
ncbi:MAG TPA: hypothetical protein DHU56_08730 [Marinobacter sp.]|jgi:CheY-like chemotaxis protein|uniref:response regulator n=1 Tax=Marinobacter sp. TaxID=50741 RepID=UPI000ED6DD08|nr:response regulator [Marinobacter sp.]MBC7192467.1 response regulator [Marinobacter sp.]HCW90119.1 hypothetical protein [Marinobacter sp.]